MSVIGDTKLGIYFKIFTYILRVQLKKNYAVTLLKKSTCEIIQREFLPLTPFEPILCVVSNRTIVENIL